MLIKNYLQKNNQEDISFLFLIQTPDISGLSSAIQIKTLTNEFSGKTMDQDTQFALIQIQDISSPEEFNIELSDSSVYLTENIISKISFNMKLTITLPQNGFLKFNLPEGLETIQIQNENCWIQNSSQQNFIQSPQCYQLENSIFVQIENPFYLDEFRSVEFRNCFLSPQQSKEFHVDVNTILSDGKSVLQSFTQKINFDSLKLINPSFELISREKGQEAMIKIEFEAPRDFPENDTQNILSKKFSYIIIQIEPDDNFNIDQDLKFGVKNKERIPCKNFQDFEQYFDDQVYCRLLISQTPKIKIENFKKISKGQKIGIFIPNFTNLEGNTRISVFVVQSFQNQLEELGNYQQNFIILNEVLPEKIISYAGLQNYYNISNILNGEFFELIFDLKFQEKVEGNEKILIQLPNYSEGFCQNLNIQCYIQELEFPCYCVSKSDWIFIQTSEFQEIPPQYVLLRIKGLKWPNSISLKQQQPLAKIVTQDNQTRRIYQYPYFPFANPRQFTQAEIIPNTTRQIKGTTYVFKFQTNTEISEKSSLVINFPRIYDLLQSRFPILLELRINSENFDSSFKIFTAKIKFSSLPLIQKNTPFEIIIKGIINPNYFFLIQDFETYIMNPDGLLVISAINFDKFYLNENFEVKTTKIEKLEVFPKNADLISTYIFHIKIPSSLQQNTQIQIQFPSDYRDIPSIPDCQVSGIINSFLNCLPGYSTIYLILDKEYIYDDNNNILIWKIYNIKNPDKGNKKDFQVNISYDNQVLIYSQEEFSLEIKPKAEKILLKNYEFDPKNEGEYSSFNISFIPTNDISEYDEIDLIFPEIFDDYIGDDLLCTLTIIITKQIKCKVIRKRLILSDLQNYLSSSQNEILLKIFNIQNPNLEPQIFTEQIYYISLGIRNPFSEFYNDFTQDIKVDLFQAPGWMTINSIKPSNLKCRYISSLKFNINFTAALPKKSALGKLIIKLPVGFKNENKILKGQSFSENWKQIEAKIENNFIIVTGNSEDFREQLIANIFGLENPIDEIQVDSFIFSSYDGVNKKILQRTYQNVDPQSYFYYYPGPRIIINNNEVINLIRGTTSDKIPIFIENQAAFNLTLHSNNIPHISLYPFPIIINIGIQNSFFQISIPEDYNEGEYEMIWQLKGEKLPKIYTPMKNSKIKISSKNSLKINLKMENKFPFGGNTLPFLYYLDLSPDIRIFLEVNLKKDYKGIVLDKYILDFRPQITEQYFQLSFNSTDINQEEFVKTIELDIVLQGENKELYFLENQTLSINIDPLDSTSVQVNSLTLEDFGFNEVNFKIVLSKECIIYYLVALKGTQEPTIQEIKNKKSKDPIINPIFGSIYVYSKEIFNKNFQIKNLKPSQEYQFFYFVENLGKQSNQIPYNYTFKTKDIYKTAEVSLRINQTFLTFQEKQEILQHIATLLSLNKDRVIEKKQYQQDFGRRLQNINNQDNIRTIFTFNILPVENNPLYPAPKILGDSLNDKIPMLKSRIQTLDDSYRIQSIEYSVQFPKYQINPYVKQIFHNSIKINLQLDYYGFIFCVAIKNPDKNQFNNITPVQISLGLDYFNRMVIFSQIEIEEYWKEQELIVQNLEELTNYVFFMVAADINPGFPTLDNAKFIKIIEETTIKGPEKDFINLNSKKILIFIKILIFLLIFQLILII